MAEISAATVMKLRKMSGQGMMDCKKALQECDGDPEAAMDMLRKKGAATLAKRADRETSEGVVVGNLSDDGKTGILATLQCETDFVAKSEDFVAVAQKLGDYALACEADEGADNVMETELDGVKFSQLFSDLVSKTGEKTAVGEYQKYRLDGPGVIEIYIHFNHKAGTMVQIDADSDATAGSEQVRQAAMDTAMHVTATNPMGLDESTIDPSILEKEKEIASEQFKGKPPQVVEKILEGKMRKFFEDNCLISQPFVKDDSKTVGEMVAQAGKAAGGDAKIRRFVRFDIG